MINTKFLLDSGDPDEYKEIAKLAKEKRNELWGSTTNPSLIAKKLGSTSASLLGENSRSELSASQKLTFQEAFDLQKKIVFEILDIVPGAVSAEVYADEKTTAEEMIEQGREIGKWHRRVVVKLPTIVEGFKARTELRKEKIPTNNTLVFSQQQIFAICLHEYIIQKQFGPTNDLFPPFISPFVGRLDDIGENGMMLVEHGMKLKKLFKLPLPESSLAMWMLEASVRTRSHVEEGITLGTELITAPAKVYREWFSSENKPQTSSAQNLKPIEYWTPPQELFKIETIDQFMNTVQTGTLDISHPLTDKGIVKFAEDWKSILK